VAKTFQILQTLRTKIIHVVLVYAPNKNNIISDNIQCTSKKRKTKSKQSEATCFT